MQINRFEIEAMAKMAADAYTRDHQDMNEFIAKTANERGMNDEQISRVVTKSNTLVNGKLIKEARAAGNDPRLSFDLASLPGVKSHLETGVKTAERMAGFEKEARMFSIPDTKSTLADVFEKVAESKENDEVSGDPLDITYAIIKTASVPDLEAHTQEAVVRVFDDLIKMAQMEWYEIEDQVQEVEGHLKKIAAQHIASGTTPATIVDLCRKQFGQTKTAEWMVEHVIAEGKFAGVKAGISDVDDMTIIPKDNDLQKIAYIIDRKMSDAAHVERVIHNMTDLRQKIATTR